MATSTRSNIVERSAPSGEGWLIVGTSGSPKLVNGTAEVRDLLDQDRISADSRVYAITAAPRRLRDIPELRHLVSQGVWTAPPVRQSAAAAERAELSRELAILDRPLEDDVEYYDERPPSRARGIKLLLMMLIVAGVGFGAFTARNDGTLFTRIGSWIGLRVAAAAPLSGTPGSGSVSHM